MTERTADEDAAVAAIESTFGPVAPRLLNVFVGTARRDLALVREHAAAGRTQEMSHAAHSLKGAAAVLQLAAVADLADRVQHATAGEAAPRIARLEAAVERIVAAIGRAGHGGDATTI